MTIKQLFLCLSLFTTTLIQTNVIEVTSETAFQKLILNKQPIIIDFYASWCPPCQNMKTIFEAVSEQFDKKVIFAKVNVDNLPKLTQRHNISTIPTFVTYYQGSKVETIVGSQKKEALVSIVQNLLQKS
tara:strand:- start:2884 stop:3270 length:387 start_codon:yes stop_codon:yes gene_type:complete